MWAHEKNTMNLYLKLTSIQLASLSAANASFLSHSSVIICHSDHFFFLMVCILLSPYFPTNDTDLHKKLSTD